MHRSTFFAPCARLTVPRFVHGGDWREPSLDRKSFRKTQDLLLKSPNILAKIAAFVSLDYRLSPFPTHKTNPSSPTDPARNIHHPTHILDVLTALQYLQTTYSIQDHYILTGHSTGGSLVYQALMSTRDPSTSPPTPPLAVLGVSGMYDLPLFVIGHPDQESIIKNAIGDDVSVWKAASPALNVGKKGWRDPQLAMLAHSRDDQEVDEGQPQTMLQALEDHPSDSGEGGGQRRNRLIMLKGQHNELWEEGSQLAKAIEEAVEMVSGFT